MIPDTLELKKVLYLAPLYFTNNTYSSEQNDIVFQNVLPENTECSSGFIPNGLTSKFQDLQITSGTCKDQGQSRSLAYKPQAGGMKPAFISKGPQQKERSSLLGIEINIITAYPNAATASGAVVSMPANESFPNFPPSLLLPDSRGASLSESSLPCSSANSATKHPGVSQPGVSLPGLKGFSNPISAEPIYAESFKRKLRSQCKLTNKDLEEQQQDHEKGEQQVATITSCISPSSSDTSPLHTSSSNPSVAPQLPPTSPTSPLTPLLECSVPPYPTDSPFSGALSPQFNRSPPIPPKRSPSSPIPSPTPTIPLLRPPDISFVSVASISGPHASSCLIPALYQHSTSNDEDRKTTGTLSPSDSNEGARSGLDEAGVASKIECGSRAAFDTTSSEAVGNGKRGCMRQHQDSHLSQSVQDEDGEHKPSSPRCKDRDRIPIGQSNEGAGPAVVNSRPDNGASQEQAVVVQVPPGTTSSRMLTKGPRATAAMAGSPHLGQESPPPPPPPPKKQHRLCPKMIQRGWEQDHPFQQGSVESLTRSLRGLGNSQPRDRHHSLTDGLDGAKRSCPSPSSPLPSPASPNPSVSSGSSSYFSTSLPHSTQHQSRPLLPPPLPEKKLTKRSVTIASRSYLSSCRQQGNVNGGVASLPSPQGGHLSHPSPSGASEACPLPARRTTHNQVAETKSLALDQSGLQKNGAVVAVALMPQQVCIAPCHAPTHTNSAPTHTSSTLQLHALLNNMDSREGIYSKLGGLYAESLRRLAIKCDEHFTRRQKNTLHFDENNWSLFKLTCNTPVCHTGDGIYFSASCASDVANTYAVKICRVQGPDSKQAHLYGLSIQQSLPPHFNLQQDCGHFIACVPQSMMGTGEGSRGPTTGSVTTDDSEQEHVVVITTDVPHQSAFDFVQEWAPFHKAQPEVYERRVCFLLLQLCNGLDHLKTHGISHRNLCLENLLLVPHSYAGSSPDSENHHQNQQLPRLLISNFTKAKQPNTEGPTKTDPRLKRDHARLAPEIVSAAQYRKFDEFQVGILIYELLHQPNPFELVPALKEQEYSCHDLPPIPDVSLYSRGLQRLASLLLLSDPIKRIHIQDARRVLQSLLWGPRQELIEQHYRTTSSPDTSPTSGPSSSNMVTSSRGGLGDQHEGLLNWLDVKRALLMMKFAERSLEPERNAELEDWLCCQYFSTAHPVSLCRTAELLYSFKVKH